MLFVYLGFITDIHKLVLVYKELVGSVFLRLFFTLILIGLS